MLCCCHVLSTSLQLTDTAKSTMVDELCNGALMVKLSTSCWMIISLSYSTKIEDPRDKSITSFLLDVPALPVNPVCSFLKELSSRGSLFATLSLMTASKLMEERPPLQRTMLYLVLELTTAIDEDTREKAIRLVKNKLHSAMEFAGEIEAFAVQSLHKLKDVKQEDKDLENGEDDFVIEETEDAEEDWERFCSLYMALCTRNKSLLRYSQAEYVLWVFPNYCVSIKTHINLICPAQHFAIHHICSFILLLCTCTTLP